MALLFPQANALKISSAQLSQHAPICAITCQHGPTVPFVSCAETDGLCGTVMMAFASMPWCLVFVPVAKARLTQNIYLLRSLQIRSLNLIHEDTSVFSSNLLSVGLPVEASNGTEIRDPNCYHLLYPQCMNLRKL